MKHKRKIAWGLIVALVATIFPGQIIANPQQAVENMWMSTDIHIQRNVTTDTIDPMIGFTWKQAGKANSVPGQPDHDVEFYKVQITDKVKGTSLYTKEIPAKPGVDITYNIELGPTTQFLNEKNEPIEGKLESGKYYEASVLAMHYHDQQDNQGNIIRVPQWSQPSIEKIEFITDVNTRVETAKEGLKVTWDYVPGMDYRISYAQDEKGELNTKAKIEGASNDKGTVNLTAGEINALPKKDGRVEYIIKNLDQRARYSLFVEVQNVPKTIKYNQNKDETGPKVISGMTAISLRYELISANSLKLIWDNIPTTKLIRVVAEGRPVNSGGNFKEIAEKNNLPGGEFNPLTNIVIDRPEIEMEYRIAFYYEGQKDPVYSSSVFYEPIFAEVPPYSPKIPELYTATPPEALEKRAEYFVTGDKIAEDVKINWQDKLLVERTFHAAFTPQPYIQIVWDAPKKENEQGKIEVDYNLAYDVWIGEDFDEVSKLDYEGIVIEEERVGEGDSEKLITQYNNPNEVIGMRLKITKDAEGNPIKKNRTYYIKVRAKKRVSGTEDAYINSEPVVVGITIDKDGNITKPVVIGKPPLRIKDKPPITKESMVVEWATLWGEILANDPTKYTGDEKLLAESGSSTVYQTGTSGDTPIRFKPQEGVKPTELFGKSEQEIKDLIKKLPMTNYYSKILNLGKEVKYEMAVEPYDAIYNRLNGRSLEQWMKEVAKSDADSGLAWEKFEPKESVQIEANGYNRWLEQEINHTTKDGAALKANTRYIIMLRAYRVVDGKEIPQSFPSYVIGTTLTDFPVVEPKPIAPDIKVVGETDHSLDAEWTYNKDFEYELRYSTGDDPEKAKVWEFKVVDDIKLHNPEKNIYYLLDGKPAKVTIRGLFPETVYNVWIRAKQKVGQEVSQWSTPATGQTKTLLAPDIPRGLGAASKLNLKDLGLDYDPVGSDYITIEWMKNPDDLGVQTEGTMTKFYSYDIMFADNVEFENSTVITIKDDTKGDDSIEVLAKNIIRYMKLLPNRPYYFKVRARVTMSDSELKKEISKESDYSKWVRIMTKKTDDEYDGGDNDNTVTYPDKIEENYDNGIWEWEIVDAQGTITDIVETNDYFYTIDMELYEGRYDARIRRITMPVSVVQALVGQRMEIKVITNVGVYRIPAHALSYKLEKVQAKDKVQFDFETMLAYDLRNMSKPYPYVVEGGEKLSIYLKSRETGTKHIEHFDAPIEVALKLKEKTAYQNSTYKTYTYDYSQGDWIEGSHIVQAKEEGTYLNYRNDRTGIYTVYRVDTYHDIRDINYGMQQLLANYNIVNLGTIYKEQDRVHSDQYINLMLGLAQGTRDIQLDGYVGSAAKDKALITKLYVPSTSGYLTQEEAINGVVRLYEMKTGYRVKPSTKAFNEVSSQYRETVAKAYTLGLMESIDPKKQVTYGELCTWIHMVLPN